MGEPDSTKLTKRQFITKIYRKTGYTREMSKKIYDAFMNTLLDELFAGNEVILTGFGTFSLKPHKGHKVRFSEKGEISDYLILKFTTSEMLIHRLRESSPELIEKIVNSQKDKQKEE